MALTSNSLFQRKSIQPRVPTQEEMDREAYSQAERQLGYERNTQVGNLEGQKNSIAQNISNNDLRMQQVQKELERYYNEPQEKDPNTIRGYQIEMEEIKRDSQRQQARLQAIDTSVSNVRSQTGLSYVPQENVQQYIESKAYSGTRGEVTGGGHTYVQEDGEWVEQNPHWTTTEVSGGTGNPFVETTTYPEEHGGGGYTKTTSIEGMPDPFPTYGPSAVTRTQQQTGRQEALTYNQRGQIIGRDVTKEYGDNVARIETSPMGDTFFMKDGRVITQDASGQITETRVKARGSELDLPINVDFFGKKIEIFNAADMMGGVMKQKVSEILGYPTKLYETPVFKKAGEVIAFGSGGILDLVQSREPTAEEQLRRTYEGAEPLSIFGNDNPIITSKYPQGGTSMNFQMGDIPSIIPTTTSITGGAIKTSVTGGKLADSYSANGATIPLQTRAVNEDTGTIAALTGEKLRNAHLHDHVFILRDGRYYDTGIGKYDSKGNLIGVDTNRVLKDISGGVVDVSGKYGAYGENTKFMNLVGDTQAKVGAFRDYLFAQTNKRLDKIIPTRSLITGSVIRTGGEGILSNGPERTGGAGMGELPLITSYPTLPSRPVKETAEIRAEARLTKSQQNIDAQLKEVSDYIQQGITEQKWDWETGVKLYDDQANFFRRKYGKQAEVIIEKYKDEAFKENIPSMIGKGVFGGLVFSTVSALAPPLGTALGAYYLGSAAASVSPTLKSLSLLSSSQRTAETRRIKTGAGISLASGLAGSVAGGLIFGRVRYGIEKEKALNKQAELNKMIDKIKIKDISKGKEAAFEKAFLTIKDLKELKAAVDSGEFSQGSYDYLSGRVLAGDVIRVYRKQFSPTQEQFSAGVPNIIGKYVEIWSRKGESVKRFVLGADDALYLNPKGKIVTAPRQFSYGELNYMMKKVGETTNLEGGGIIARFEENTGNILQIGKEKVQNFFSPAIKRRIELKGGAGRLDYIQKGNQITILNVENLGKQVIKGTTNQRELIRTLRTKYPEANILMTVRGTAFPDYLKVGGFRGKDVGYAKDIMKAGISKKNQNVLFESPPLTRNAEYKGFTPVLEQAKLSYSERIKFMGAKQVKGETIYEFTMGKKDFILREGQASPKALANLQKGQFTFAITDSELRAAKLTPSFLQAIKGKQILYGPKNEILGIEEPFGFAKEFAKATPISAAKLGLLQRAVSRKFGAEIINGEKGIVVNTFYKGRTGGSSWEIDLVEKVSKIKKDGGFQWLKRKPESPKVDRSFTPSPSSGGEGVGGRFTSSAFGQTMEQVESAGDYGGQQTIYDLGGVMGKNKYTQGMQNVNFLKQDFARPTQVAELSLRQTAVNVLGMQTKQQLLNLQTSLALQTVTQGVLQTKLQMQRNILQNRLQTRNVLQNRQANVLQLVPQTKMVLQTRGVLQTRNILQNRQQLQLQQRQVQQQRQQQRQKQISRNVPQQRFNFKFKAIPELESSIGVQAFPKAQGTRKKVEAFVPLVKKKGKFVVVGGKTTRTKALMFGQEIALRTAAVTFDIKPAGEISFSGKEEEFVPSPLFRRYKIRKGKKIPTSEYIQATNKRIVSFGEKREISFRGAAARRQSVKYF